MIVSTRGRYALRVMIDLAQQDSEKYIPLKEIANRQEISEKYLESVLSVLSKNDFLTGVRGKGGGYKLSRKPEEYTVGSILRLTEVSLAPVNCLECTPNKCEKASHCPTLPMWEKLNEMINSFFENITLQDLAYGKK